MGFRFWGLGFRVPGLQRGAWGPETSTCLGPQGLQECLRAVLHAPVPVSGVPREQGSVLEHQTPDRHSNGDNLSLIRFEGARGVSGARIWGGGVRSAWAQFLSS